RRGAPGRLLLVFEERLEDQWLSLEDPSLRGAPFPSERSRLFPITGSTPGQGRNLQVATCCRAGRIVRMDGAASVPKRDDQTGEAAAAHPLPDAPRGPLFALPGVLRARPSAASRADYNPGIPALQAPRARFCAWWPVYSRRGSSARAQRDAPAARGGGRETGRDPGAQGQGRGPRLQRAGLPGRTSVRRRAVGPSPADL